MLTTDQMVDEMMTEAKQLGPLLIVIELGNRTKFVRSSDPDALQKLNELLAEGGKPIALCGLYCEGWKRYEERK
jgi:hypothetical protein